MAEKKTGDPKDEAQHVGGGRFVPVALHGIGVVLPGPRTAGPPKPEPEERWTLGPGRHHEPPPEADEAPVEPAPLEPVRGTVSRPAREEGEADPS